MTEGSFARPSRLRALGGVVLGLGLSAALAIYVTAGPEDGLPPGYDVTQTKPYRHQLELYGGKAGLQFDEFRRWFGTLWHGKPLAGTVAFLSVAAFLAMRFVAPAWVAAGEVEEPSPPR
jgi:hypothetical protein